MNTLPLFILVTLSFMQVPTVLIQLAMRQSTPWPMGPCCRAPPRASAIGAAAQASRKRAKEIKKSKSCKSIFDEANNKRPLFPLCETGKAAFLLVSSIGKGPGRRKRQRSAACRRPMRRALERLCSVYSARSFFMAGIMRLTTHQAMTATAITMMTIFTMSEKPSTC